MKRNIKRIIYLIVICVFLCACTTKQNKQDSLTDYVISEAVRYCYDYVGYDLNNNYQLVEKNNKEEFPKIYYVLENDNPLMFLRIDYSDEEFYGGFEHKYNDGNIAIGKYGLVDFDVTYDLNTAIYLNDYLLIDENIDVELIENENNGIVCTKDSLDLSFFEINYEDLSLKQVNNYYVMLLDCPNYIDGNRKTIRIIEDVYDNYLIFNNNKCIGVIKYDNQEKVIVEQYKEDICEDCNFIITSNGLSNIYYLTGNTQIDDIELNKYSRITNSIVKAYDYLSNK